MTNKQDKYTVEVPLHSGDKYVGRYYHDFYLPAGSSLAQAKEIGRRVCMHKGWPVANLERDCRVLAVISLYCTIQG